MLIQHINSREDQLIFSFHISELFWFFKRIYRIYKNCKFNKSDMMDGPLTPPTHAFGAYTAVICSTITNEKVRDICSTMTNKKVRDICGTMTKEKKEGHLQYNDQWKSGGTSAVQWPMKKWGDICSTMTNEKVGGHLQYNDCLLYTSPSPRD